MATVLVTGGAGFIGSHLVDRLLERGADVRVLDNLSTGSLRNLQAAADRQALGAGGSAARRRLELVIGDVRDTKLVRKTMRHVDCVFHLAALPPGLATATNPAEVHTVNVQGTLNVLQAATAEGVARAVLASCASVYGTAAPVPVSENCAAQPVTVFAASKLAGEIYGRAYHTARHLETVVLRYFQVYGPRQSNGTYTAPLPALIDTLRRRRRPVIAGDIRAAHDFLYVEDAVEATLAAATAAGAAGRAVNVGSGQAASMLEVLDVLNRLLRTDVVPRLGRTGRGLAPTVRADVQLAAELFAWSPRTSLVTGLARSVEFFTALDSGEDALLAEVGSHEERADV